MSHDQRDRKGAGRAGGTSWHWAPETYGDRIADVYDAWYGNVDEAIFDTLVELAGEGPALELGIGTGRVALPLAARGVEVHGIDASPAMIEKLRAKPGGEDLKVTVGAFDRFDLDGRTFSLVFVVFNTFFALATQDEQVSCFESVARHLAPGGVFVLETFVPDVTRFTRGQNTSTTSLTSEHVVLEASVHDRALQRVRSQHVLLKPSGTELYPVEIRYAWPSEMDLMARLAGLELRDRWSSWRRAPFDSASEGQIVVYGKAT